MAYAELDPEMIELGTPIIRDESGNQLAVFESATLAPRNPPHLRLMTEPCHLPPDFPFGTYNQPNAPPLYLESGQYRLRVVAVGVFFSYLETRLFIRPSLGHDVSYKKMLSHPSDTVIVGAMTAASVVIAALVSNCEKVSTLFKNL